jgi:hypothetical protein
MWNERALETLPFTADEWARIGRFKRMTDLAFVTHLNTQTLQDNACGYAASRNFTSLRASC